MDGPLRKFTKSGPEEPSSTCRSLLQIIPDAALPSLCDREYGFLYEEVRRRHGLAWYALIDSHGQICWEANLNYQKSSLVVRKTRDYRAFGLEAGIPLYSQFEKNPDKLQWVSKPALVAHLWNGFVP